MGGDRRRGSGRTLVPKARTAAGCRPICVAQMQKTCCRMLPIAIRCVYVQRVKSSVCLGNLTARGCCCCFCAVLHDFLTGMGPLLGRCTASSTLRLCLILVKPCLYPGRARAWPRLQCTTDSRERAAVRSLTRRVMPCTLCPDPPRPGSPTTFSRSWPL